MANSYLSSNTGTATNAKKWTYSVWLKRSKISSEQRFYQGYKDSNNRAYAVFLSNDKMRVYNMTASNIELYWDTNRVFRDTNAWYHIVLSADSTQATQADRYKVYINGVQETDFSKSYNPGQNIDWGNQLAQTNGDLTISGTESQTQLFEGYMSHAAFVDGTALTPTSFGETDSTSGIWKFKSPTGITWGNNGYHLKFENSGALGTDSSGNSNTFTVNGNLKQSLDTPSNVHATLNPLINNGGKATLSNGNTVLTDTSTNAWSWLPSTLGVSKGKWYWEWKAGTIGAGSFQSWGIVNDEALHQAETYIGSIGANGYAMNWDGDKYHNGVGASYGSVSSNDIIGCALDLDNGIIWLSVNGTWQNSATQTEVENGTSTNAMYSGIDTTKTWFAGSVVNDSTVNSINFGNGFFGTTAIASAGSNGNGSLFEYDVPNGYYALNTKNINTYG